MARKRFFQRVKVDGELVQTTGPVTQSESLEAGDAFTASVPVAVIPTIIPSPSGTIAIEDLDTGEYQYQLGGNVDLWRGNPDPTGIALIFEDVMSDLRQVRTSDFDLTGMTDGEAVQYILDWCGVGFDPDDIADLGYVLGIHEPIKWLKNVSGAEMITEIDRNLQCRTMAIGGDGSPAARVIRFHYDLLPNDQTPQATYTRAEVTTPYFGAGRSFGGRADIRNRVEVRGVSYDCGDDGECTCTPWAVAKGSHPDITGRSKSLDHQSDIIQTTDLCVELATLFLKQYNRRPDTVQIKTVNDANIIPGSIVRVVDDGDHIDLGSGRKYVVTNVSRIANRMTLDCVGGAAGNVSSVESGVEVVCRELRTNDPPDAPDFEFPGPGTPPEVPSIPTAGSSWSCGSDDIESESDWTTSTGTITDG
jgi:hypothetical protein